MNTETEIDRMKRIPIEDFRTAWASSRAKACQCRMVQVALPGGKDTVFQGEPGEKSLV